MTRNDPPLATRPPAPKKINLAVLFILAAMFITVPLLVGRPAWAAAAASIAVTLLGAGWPHKLGTFAAVLACVAAALWAWPQPRRD